jgi:hypothetical protein
MDPDPDLMIRNTAYFPFLFANTESLSCFGDTRLFFVELPSSGGTRSVEQDQAGVRGCGLSSAAIRLMLHGRIQQLHTEVTFSDKDAGCLSLPDPYVYPSRISHHGSRIQQQQQKRRGKNKLS